MIMDTSVTDKLGSLFPRTLENPYFSAGFSLGVIGVSLSVLKHGIMYANIFAKRRSISTIEIPSTDRAYHWVMKHLMENRKNCFLSNTHLSLITRKANDSSDGEILFDLIPSPGRHFIKFQNTYLMIDRERSGSQLSLHNSCPFETITISTLSRNARIFADLISSAYKKDVASHKGLTRIYHSVGPEWRQFGHPKKCRSFDSVILPDGVAVAIYGDLFEFLECKQWYIEKGIPYRRGYLLHGPPGCGKTSFITALIGHLNLDIAVLNLSEPTLTDDRLQFLLASVPDRAVILLEDVDSVLDSNDNDGSRTDNRYLGLKHITFSGLLNAIDGATASDSRVLFMTTNRPHLLPLPLTRPGRVDLKVYIGYATFDQAKLLFRKFFPDSPPDMDYNFAHAIKDSGSLFSMAELQGYLQFFKLNPSKALDHMNEFFEKTKEARSSSLAAF